MSKIFKILFSLSICANLIILYSIQHNTVNELENLTTDFEIETNNTYELLNPEEPTIPQINKPFNDLKESIYVIRPLTIEAPNYGSGILIKENTILTVWHTLRPRYEDVPKEEWLDINLHVQKNLHNNSSPHDANLVAYSEKYDLAIIHVEGLSCPCVPLYDGKISYDETVYTAYQLTSLNIEIITQGRFVSKSGPFYFTTNPLYYGASGGGVFVKRNNKFRLIGTIRSIPMGMSNDGKRDMLNYITISVGSEIAIDLLENY